MILEKISIKNYRSIKEMQDFKISRLQALIGENNAGKSNILKAIGVFLTAGSGGIKEEDFNHKEEPIIIKCCFTVEENETKSWKSYLINNELILEKHIWYEKNEDSDKQTLKNEFHGYKAEPNDWFLSVKGIEEFSNNDSKYKKGNSFDWIKIVNEKNLPAYFKVDEKCTKDNFTKGLEKYLLENDVTYHEPDLSKTQALGLKPNVIANLPRFYILEAITDYSDEINKQSTKTTYRQLMGDLSERIIKKDPEYQRIEKALETINDLFNKKKVEGQELKRITSLESVEERIKEILQKLIPDVNKVNLKIVLEDLKTIFSKGVELTIDDGVDTDVLLKGHGLQRCIVFSLLQALILNNRNQLIEFTNSNNEKKDSSIILAIEEPELYIHPQLEKLFYDVLNQFSKTDQVIYSTHSTRFIDVYQYDCIAIVKKIKEQGTYVKNCDLSAFNDLQDRAIYNKLSMLNADINELFFARNVILVEGPEDKLAITETLKKQNKINYRTEELDITVIMTGGKPSIPFFLRILNAFNINYVVLHDLDIIDISELSDDLKEKQEKRNKEHKQWNEDIQKISKANKL
jgi:putative ATP-dependent endonuclease of the OLD family